MFELAASRIHQLQHRVISFFKAEIVFGVFTSRRLLPLMQKPLSTTLTGPTAVVHFSPIRSWNHLFAKLIDQHKRLPPSEQLVT